MGLSGGAVALAFYVGPELGFAAMVKEGLMGTIEAVHTGGAVGAALAAPFVLLQQGAAGVYTSCFSRESV